MSEMGTEPAPARVRFGKRDTQDVPHEWAETMLTWWADHKPNEFGKVLQLAAVGSMPGRNGNGRAAG